MLFLQKRAAALEQDVCDGWLTSLLRKKEQTCRLKKGEKARLRVVYQCSDGGGLGSCGEMEAWGGVYKSCGPARWRRFEERTVLDDRGRGV